VQEGFLAQDDAGAHDAYERELDDEDDIRRMEAEAAVHRAEGAARVNGASLRAAPAQDAAGAILILLSWEMSSYQRALA
jgi:hypothetical protein